MVGTPPTRVRVEFVSPDEPNYVLEEATFEVDGKAVKGLPLATLSSEGTHTVFAGEVTPGKHKVSAKLLFASRASAVVSDEGGYKWKVGGDATFEVNPGIEVQVQVVPSRDSTQKDIGKRFTLRMPAEPVMVAKLDDGKMPPPPPKADVIKAADEGEKTVAAIEKAVAAVKVEPAEALGEPRRAPAPQELSVEPAPGQSPVALTAVDAGELVAGVPAIVDPPADPAPVAAAPTGAVDAGGSLWPWLVGGGVLVLLLVLFVVTRRRSGPPAGHA